MPLYVVFDNAPDDAAAWMTGAARACGLHFVSAGEVAKQLATYPEFVKLVNSEGVKDFHTPHPALKPFYEKALATLAGGKAKVALDGFGWVTYAPALAGYVRDPAPLARSLASAEEFGSISNAVALKYRADVDKAYDKALEKRLKPAQILNLPAGASDAEKQKKAVEFIQKLGA